MILFLSPVCLLPFKRFFIMENGKLKSRESVSPGFSRRNHNFSYIPVTFPWVILKESKVSYYSTHRYLRAYLKKIWIIF